MRVPREQFRCLSLAVHGLLRDVPLHDVTAVDLPGAAHPLVRGLFALRALLGRLWGWDAARPTHPETSSLHRLSSDITRRCDSAG